MSGILTNLIIYRGCCKTNLVHQRIFFLLFWFNGRLVFIQWLVVGVLMNFLHFRDCCTTKLTYPVILFRFNGHVSLIHRLVIEIVMNFKHIRPSGLNISREKLVGKILVISGSGYQKST